MRRVLAVGLLLMLGACGASQAPVKSRELPPAPPPPAMADEGGACAADVRQCPDGSFASRNPARGCAFDACPGETNKQ